MELPSFCLTFALKRKNGTLYKTQNDTSQTSPTFEHIQKKSCKKAEL